MIESPITRNKNTIYLTDLNISDLKSKYLKNLNINIDSYFNGTEKISLHQCLDTGYRFFIPANLGGDEKFYKQLEKINWYYDPWKWEHESSLNWITPNSEILEIGCGKGSFIKHISENFNCNAVGLELNTSKVQDIVILNETIEFHSEYNTEKYDVVCSFQVMEHIYNIDSFLNSSIKSLKKGGYLIISVPNNDSFIKHDFPNDILNLPPHHMGWWNEESLKKALNFFSLKHISTKFEPLRDQHISWYLNVVENRILKFSYPLTKIFQKFKIKGILKRILKINIFKPLGHTVLVVFQKQ